MGLRLVNGLWLGLIHRLRLRLGLGLRFRLSILLAELSKLLLITVLVNFGYALGYWCSVEYIKLLYLLHCISYRHILKYIIIVNIIRNLGFRPLEILILFLIIRSLRPRTTLNPSQKINATIYPTIFPITHMIIHRQVI